MKLRRRPFRYARETETNSYVFSYFSVVREKSVAKHENHTRFTQKSQHNILTKLFNFQVNNLTILQYIVTVLKVTFYYYTKEIY